MSILGQNQLQKLGNWKQRPAKEESHWGGKAGSKKRIQCRPACSDRTLGASWLTCTWGRENMNKVQDCQGVKLLKNPRYGFLCCVLTWIAFAQNCWFTLACLWENVAWCKVHGGRGYLWRVSPGRSPPGMPLKFGGKAIVSHVIISPLSHQSD